MTTIPITVNIPDSIQPPKFHLFQEVCLAPKSPTSKSDCSRVGVIVGMTYIPLFQALVERFAGFGWEYQVDFYFNAPFEKALDCEDPVQTYDEADLAPFTAQAKDDRKQVAAIN